MNDKQRRAASSDRVFNRTACCLGDQAMPRDAVTLPADVRPIPDVHPCHQSGQQDENEEGYLRQSPSEWCRLAPPAQETMSLIDWFAVHHRASANNARYAICLARLDRLFGNASTTDRSMKPHARDIPFDGLAHHVYRHAGMSCDNNSIQRRGYACEIRIAFRALNLRSVRIDRKNLVPRIPQFSKDGIGGTALPAGYASHSKPASAEEILDCFRCVHVGSSRE